MTDTFVDTNVLLDVFGRDDRWFAWSRAALAQAAEEGRIVFNQIVYAELAARYSHQEELDAVLAKQPFAGEDLSWDAAFLAGQAYVAYRRRGGTRLTPLPDFFIGAHAASRGYRLLTRDRGPYATYFPALEIISPERS